MWLMDASPGLFTDLYEMTMAHSFIETHQSEEQAFRNYTELYGDQDLYKTSPEKGTVPGRKTILRSGSPTYEKDTIIPFEPQPDDLLQPFRSAEPMQVIQERLNASLTALPDPVKRITEPAKHLVEFAGFSA